MPWFKLSGDDRITKRCASAECAGQPTWRLEAHDVGSDYCSGCKDKIDPHWADLEDTRPPRMIRETITFTFKSEAQQARFHERLEAATFECAARAQGTAGGNDPADCDWPVCDCDPHAAKVIAALHESGWKSPDEVREYAKKTRAQVVREYEADKD